VTILRPARGATVWSAGHDVGELPTGGRDPLGWDDPLRYPIRETEQFPAPVIAMIEGGVWGGACETVLACDLVIAAPSANFAVTPAKLGVPYNVSGMLTFLNAAELRIVKEMVFTAKPISARRGPNPAGGRRPGLFIHQLPAYGLSWARISPPLFSAVWTLT
jgi:methylmalonyl-CoA decarboxylase